MLEPDRRHIIGYSLTSANDCPVRDPTGWTLFGRVDENSEWLPIHKVTERDLSHQFNHRWETLHFTLDKEFWRIGFSSLHLQIDSVRILVSGVQMGHWHNYSIDSKEINWMERQGLAILTAALKNYWDHNTEESTHHKEAKENMHIKATRTFFYSSRLHRHVASFLGSTIPHSHAP